MKIENNAIWLMYSYEGKEHFFSKFITTHTIAPAYSIIGDNKKFLIVNALDEDNVLNDEKIKDFKKYSYTNNEERNNILLKIFKELKFPKTIYLNFSVNFPVDTLGHGTFLYLQKLLKKIYNENYFKIKSSEDILLSLLETKTKEEIELMNFAAQAAQKILETTFSKIKIGMSEKEIAQLCLNELEILKSNFFKNENFSDFTQQSQIQSITPSWQHPCPIVLIGENLKKGGHSAPSEKKLQKGETIYFDFGVKLHLKNEKTYCSDIQRMGYALDKNEIKPPKEILKIFNTLIEAIEMGRKLFLPTKSGYEIDKVVRDYINKNGYPDYKHGTGHPVGEQCHDIGTNLSSKKSKKSKRKLTKNAIYTIEPRIQIENGGSIEEMVLVTENGGVFLGKQQTDLYLINN